MRYVKIAELKDRLSEHLRAVEKGDEVIVTDRNRPMVRIVPLTHSEVRITPPSTSFTAIRSRRRLPAKWKVDSLELLLEERREP
ncbi:MAG: type II toxin-antitoxin system prevent-host-death family antitoxin [Actinomycetota bacterium]|nr:type II toxin-antitoxin system prevent-host-death family antitoxin [Actinomycetota bacterium]